MTFLCEICNKKYITNSGFWKHNNKYHNNIQNNKNQVLSSNNQVLSSNNQVLSSKKYKCRYCDKTYDILQSRWFHEQTCKIKHNENKQNEINKLKYEIEILKNNTKLKQENNNIPINNQLINIITEKNKVIEELKNNKKEINNNDTINNNLTLNNIVIESRNTDHYINATQLCQAGNKKFNKWYRLDSTKLLIKELEKEIETTNDAHIWASLSHSIIETNKGSKNKNNQFTWIHPDLAIQLAQWISPSFALQVSKWIRLLFTNGTISINTLKMKDQEIQLLKDSFIKKQKRINYPNNVIYMLTTKYNKNNRIYIIGKTSNLQNRLSSYNKTSEHEVVYYKKCNKEHLNLIELNILSKLTNYQEKANRDRFILPIEKEINFFIEIINNCINFF